MLTKQRLIAGAVSLSALSMLGLTAVTTAGAQNMSVGQRVRACVQQRRASGYFDPDVTREERRQLRLQFRMCVRNAVFNNGNGNSSSRSSTSSAASMSSSSRSSASSMSSSVASSASSMSSLSSMSSSSASSMNSSSRSSMSSSSVAVGSIRNVDIEDFEYSPDTVHIKVGRTVRWTNEDQAPHTVTSDTSSSPLNSGTLQTGQTYSHMFTQPGTYHYHCALHPEMHGTIVVSD